MIPRIASAFSQITVISVALPSSSTSVGIPFALVDALDSSIRADLQQFSQDLYFWVLASAYLVALGCVLEGPEILFELWPKWFIWLTWSSKERLEGFERKAKIAGLIGWLIVFLGVASEGVFEGLQNRAEGQLQTFNDIILSDARLTAARAKESAEGAASSADRAFSTADAATGVAAKASLLAQGAESKAETFEQRIVSANELAAAAESHLAEALRGTARAELELKNIRLDEAQLELLVSPRRLTLEQQFRIREACKRWSPTAAIIESYGMDPEGKVLAQQIQRALFSPTFKVVRGAGGPLTGGAFDEGVSIKAPPEAYQYADCLAGALTIIGKLEGVTVNGVRHSNSASGNLVLSGNITMEGGGGIEPAGGLPPGSAISIFVGIKPAQPDTNK